MTATDFVPNGDRKRKAAAWGWAFRAIALQRRLLRLYKRAGKK